MAFLNVAAGTADRLMRAMGWSWGADVWVALALGAALVFAASVFLYSQSLRWAVSGNGKEVRGRFWQLPLVGETFEFLNCAHPDDILLPRIRRYGPVFRSHLFGHPTIFLTDASAAKFVLQSPKVFRSAFENVPIKHLLGASGTVHTEGHTHTQFRRLVVAPLTPEALKRSTSRIDKAAQECLRSRAPSASESNSSVVINTFDVAKKTSPKANSYTPFGNGNRVCPGSELAKLDILVFLHRFIQLYEFEATVALERKPRRLNWLLPEPPQGLPLRIRRRRR